MPWRILRKVFQFFSSLELAVFVLLSLSVVLAIGTIVESKYDLFIAQELVYRSVWNQGLLWLLLINVAAVALSRWPWRRHHVGFLITHLGIIVLLLGSFVTQRFGVDGILAIAPESSERLVRLEDKYLNIFKAVPGANYELLLSRHVPWNALRSFPGEQNWSPRQEEQVQILQFYPRARRDVTVREDKNGVPAIRMALKGSRAQMDELLFLQGPEGKDLGPALIRLVKELPKDFAPTKPTLLVLFRENSEPALYSARPKEKIRFLADLKAGQAIPVGWMDFSFEMKEYFPSAIPEVTYQNVPKSQTPSIGEIFVEAVQVRLQGEDRWLELGASAQVSSNEALYFLQFVKRHVDLGFEVKLREFNIDYYPGTKRAMEYSSLVSVGEQNFEISMNEPLKMNGFTFYQSSYEVDDNGEPVLSVLSVNRDPGRFTKYLGSLMIVLGILSMFYFKPKYSGKNKWLLKGATTEGDT